MDKGCPSVALGFLMGEVGTGWHWQLHDAQGPAGCPSLGPLVPWGTSWGLGTGTGRVYKLQFCPVSHSRWGLCLGSPNCLPWAGPGSSWWGVRVETPSGAPIWKGPNSAQAQTPGLHRGAPPSALLSSPSLHSGAGLQPDYKVQVSSLPLGL